MRPTCFELPRFLFLSFFLPLFSFLYYWHFVYSRDGGGYRFNYKIKTIGNHLAQLLINKNVSRIHKRARENKISDIFRERSRYLYFFSFSSFFFFRLSRLKFRTFFSRFTDFHHVLTIFPAFLFRFLSLRAPSRFLGFRFFSLSLPPLPFPLRVCFRRIFLGSPIFYHVSLVILGTRTCLFLLVLFVSSRSHTIFPPDSTIFSPFFLKNQFAFALLRLSNDLQQSFVMKLQNIGDRVKENMLSKKESE